MTTEQQYRVIGKSGPGVEPRADMVVQYAKRPGTAPYRLGPYLPIADAYALASWNAGDYEILEAISSPQAGIPEGWKIGAGWFELMSQPHWCNQLDPLHEKTAMAVLSGHGDGRLSCLSCAHVCGALVPDGPPQAAKCSSVNCGTIRNGIASYCGSRCFDEARATPPRAAVATCESWCGLPFGDKRVPCASDHPSIVVESHAMAALCEESYRIADCPHPAYCTQACLDRAKGTKAPECIRSACKIPPVAGGELCAAHAGQVETVKAAARPAVPPPAETRLERWLREHKGYSHGTMDPRVHDANVAAMMVGIDGPRAPYVPPPKLPDWTPRDLDGDIPNAWEPGGARLGGTR